jgi:hypothetical protein
MNINNRLEAFTELGERLRNLDDDTLYRLSRQAANKNNWFTEDNVKTAIQSYAGMLTKEKLTAWVSQYELGNITPRKVGLILAGNIPLSGFHDMLCILMAGHELHAKLNANDPVLPAFFREQMIDINSIFEGWIHFPERLNHIEALIANSLNDSSSRYFEQYFAKMPNILRKSRNSIAVLTGKENAAELKQLGVDIFAYYGLGSRNIAKLYVPQNYVFTTLFEALEEWKHVTHHHKYNNNYDYNKSVYLVNSIPHYDNGFLMLKEDPLLVSPISVLFYERYADEGDLALKLQMHKDQIQFIVSKDAWYPKSLDMGQVQSPQLHEYADNIDTMAFLARL